MHTSVTAHSARQIVGEHMIVRDHFEFVMDLDQSHGPYIVDARESVETPDGGRRAMTLAERTYLDFYTQFASWPIGYNHPGLSSDLQFVARLNRAALSKIANSDIVTTDKAAFVKAMRENAIKDGLDYMFLIAGGALAVENALKASFDWKIRLNFQRGLLYPENDYKIVHFREAFHGRSGYTMSLTNTDPDKTNFFPKFLGWPRVSNPKVRYPLDQHLEDIEKREAQTLRELDAVIQTNPHTIAAVILETIQGEGGDNHFRPEFFKKLREVTEQHDILLILDEVQAGVGITGKFWAYEHMGIIPDIVSFGKKMQVCGILANRAKFDRVEHHVFKMPGRINSTWGADLVDMVRSTKLLQIIHDEKLVQNAAVMGRYLLEGITELQGQFPSVIWNCRALGLMAAFDFFDASHPRRYQQEMYKRHVLVLTCGTHSTRLRPLLDITKEDIQSYLAAAGDALRALR